MAQSLVRGSPDEGTGARPGLLPRFGSGAQSALPVIVGVPAPGSQSRSLGSPATLPAGTQLSFVSFGNRPANATTGIRQEVLMKPLEEGRPSGFTFTCGFADARGSGGEGRALGAFFWSP